MEDSLEDIQSYLDHIQDKINNNLTRENKGPGILGMLSGGNGDDYLSQIKALKSSGSAVVDKSALGSLIGNAGLTGLTGGLSLINNSLDWAKGADLTGYQNQLAEFASHNRGQNFFDNNTLLQSYNSQPDKVKLNADMVNPTFGQSMAHIGGSALSGAMTGLQIGGVPGAIIGGFAGLAAGGFSDNRKREENRVNTGIFNYNQDTEEAKNQIAFATGADQARNTQYSQLYKNRMASGGFIRKPSVSPSGYRLYHSKCKGGTLVRIKSK